MSYKLSVSPDYNPEQLSGWFIFNTWLQKTFGQAVHFDVYDDFSGQRQAINDNKIDLIYANPYDAGVLMREKNFVPLVCPHKKTDEALIAVANKHLAQNVEELDMGCRVAYTQDPSVQMMGMIMLEPADLNKNDVRPILCENYILIAKNLIKGQADVGFFLTEAYDHLSNLVRKQLRPLVRSQIFIIHHTLMIHPDMLAKMPNLQQALLEMPKQTTGLDALHNLGFDCWDAIGQEEMEFMIDVVDTLRS
jgi:phosphonate transport system substrate-binding protein